MTIYLTIMYVPAIDRYPSRNTIFDNLCVIQSKGFSI